MSAVPRSIPPRPSTDADPASRERALGEVVLAAAAEARERRDEVARLEASGAPDHAISEARWAADVAETNAAKLAESAREELVGGRRDAARGG